MSQPQGSASSPAYYFACTACRRQIVVAPNLAGGKVDCPCGTRNVVPSIMHLARLSPPAPTQPPPASPFRAAAPPAAMHPQAARGYPPAAPAPQPAAPLCPFCQYPLQSGRILGDRYRLKWLGNETPLALGLWAVGGLEIGHGGFMQFNRPHVYGWRCGNCCKIIVDERA